MEPHGRIRYPRLRSIGAVVFGYLVLVTTALSALFLIGAIWPEALPTAEGETPGPLLRSLLLGAVFVAAAAGGYVAAIFAKRKEYQHGLALIGIVAAVGLISLFGTDGTSGELWYAIASLAAIMLGILLGVKLRIRQKAALFEEDENGVPHEHVPEARGFNASP